jgi:hypothetical protein
MEQLFLVGMGTWTTLLKILGCGGKRRGEGRDRRALFCGMDRREPHGR